MAKLSTTCLLNPSVWVAHFSSRRGREIPSPRPSTASVYLGTQARYYSLTLLMSTLVAGALLRAVRYGTWTAFVILGICETLLFHTHQLSAVIFAAAAVATLPRLMKHPQWQLKSAVAIAIAMILTVPWAVATGFFETASKVPKVFRLFESWTDLVNYVLAALWFLLRSLRRYGSCLSISPCWNKSP